MRLNPFSSTSAGAARYLFACVLIAGAAGAAQSQSSAPPVATAAPTLAVTGGQIAGARLADGSVSYRGIPYARPPVEARRWKQPEPAEPWTGVRDATASGPPCLQSPSGSNNHDAVRSREDCLYLDVHAPSVSLSARRPVLVWISGGVHWASGGEALTTSFVQRGMVVVTFQHRLGVFGFLSHPALTAESRRKASGNYALMDQIAALQWVKANIAKFGGDPGNVTLFGLGPGAQAAGLLTIAPPARGLFAKVIAQSGTAGSGLPARTLSENEKLGEAFAALAGVPASAPAPLEKLRSLYATQLLAAGNKLDAPALEDDAWIWMQAVVDGWVIPRPPADLLGERKQAVVPLLIGSASRELSLKGGAGNAQRVVQAAYGANAARALPLYGLDKPAMPPPDPRFGDVGTQVATDLHFRCPAAVMARHQQAARARAWQYQFDRAEATSGAATTTAPIPELAPASLQAYWVRFAMTGDPNGAGLPRWSEQGRKREYLDVVGGIPIAKQNFRAPFCDLLNRP